MHRNIIYMIKFHDSVIVHILEIKRRTNEDYSSSLTHSTRTSHGDKLRRHQGEQVTACITVVKKSMVEGSASCLKVIQ